MDRRRFIKQATTLSLASSAVGVVGCGTLLHNERVGQAHSRDIDWKVAGLNGLGLAFFFVPGVVAFAVDFYTGAIYLPPEYPEAQPTEPFPQQQMQLSQQPQSPTPGTVRPASATLPTQPYPSGAPVTQPGHPSTQPYSAPSDSYPPMSMEFHPSQLRQETMPHAPTQATIERFVGARIGKRISLTQETTRVSRMSGLQQFQDLCQQHQQKNNFGVSANEFFS